MRYLAHEDNEKRLRYNCRDFILDKIDRSLKLFYVL